MKKREYGELLHASHLLILAAAASFPTRRERSISADEDYAVKSHKKKFFAKANGGNSGRDTPDSGFIESDMGWRRGAAKKVVTYDEAQADYGLDSDEDVEYNQGEGGEDLQGEIEEIDMVLGHTRHEDYMDDPKDIPQENLVSLSRKDRADEHSAFTSNGRHTLISTIPTRCTRS